MRQVFDRTDYLIGNPYKHSCSFFDLVAGLQYTRAQPFNCFRRLEIVESESGIERILWTKQLYEKINPPLYLLHGAGGELVCAGPNGIADR